MRNIFINYLYWLLTTSGFIFTVFMLVIFCLSISAYRSISEDVERLSLKITSSMLNILLTWGTITLAFILSMISMLNMDLPFTGRHGLNSMGIMISVAVIPPLAFWYFERVIICFICYLIVKRKDKESRFFGKNGFMWLPRNR